MNDPHDTPPTGGASSRESARASMRLDARPRRSSKPRTVPDQDPGTFFGGLANDFSWFMKFMGDRQAKMPGRTKVIIVLALVYAISPIDFIPDVIPGVGIIDDAFVIGMVVSNLRTLAANYRKWRQPATAEVED